MLHNNFNNLKEEDVKTILNFPFGRITGDNGSYDYNNTPALESAPR